MPTDFLTSTAQQIDTLSRERTVFFFPVGPMEDHGTHLPLGLDIMEAEKLCETAALRLEKEMAGWTAVLMPSAPLGIDSNTTHFAITVRAHVLRDWLVDSVSSLRRLGFRYFACFSGHLGPRQLTAIEEAGKIIGRGNFFGLRGKSTFMSLSSVLADAAEVRRSPFWPDALEHGGNRDTSIGIFVNRELVNAIAPNLPPAEVAPSFMGREFQRLLRKTRGYWGDPRKASSEIGRDNIAATVEKVFPRLRARIDGIFAPSAFRSWYSVIPSNRSFFKSWIIALVIVAVLGLWAAVNLGTFN